MSLMTGDFIRKFIGAEPSAIPGLVEVIPGGDVFALRSHGKDMRKGRRILRRGIRACAVRSYVKDGEVWRRHGRFMFCKPDHRPTGHGWSRVA